MSCCLVKSYVVAIVHAEEKVEVQEEVLEVDID